MMDFFDGQVVASLSANYIWLLLFQLAVATGRTCNGCPIRQLVVGRWRAVVAACHDRTRLLSVVVGDSFVWRWRRAAWLWLLAI